MIVIELTAAAAGKDDDDSSAAKPTLAGEKIAVAALTIGIGAYVVQTGALSKLTGSHIFQKAAKKAIGGGISGAIAGVIQVLTLMWLRTTMNYQYRYGTSTGVAMKTLYEQGGLGRFYQGLPWALLQTPLARFGACSAYAPPPPFFFSVQRGAARIIRPLTMRVSPCALFSAGDTAANVGVLAVASCRRLQLDRGAWLGSRREWLVDCMGQRTGDNGEEREQRSEAAKVEDRRVWPAIGNMLVQRPRVEGAAERRAQGLGGGLDRDRDTVY